jgi:hypothetical protein
LFTQGLEIDRYHLVQFVEKQERFLHEVLLGLDEHSKAALALIYMRNDSLESPVELEESEREAMERLGSNLGGCLTALESLNGSLALYTQAEGVALWKFKHPTIGDAFAGLLLESPELLGIYVRGSSIDKLMGQVTCGDVGLERAVVLPKALFPLVLKRLREIPSSTEYKSSLLSASHSRHRVDRFLSSRCSKEFLVQYIEEHPDLLDRVSTPGLFLSAVSEVDLAIRLHELGLLPEQYRRRFVTQVISYAIEGEDLYALESLRTQSVFTSVELSQFRARVRAELLPNLGGVRRTWENNRDVDQPADEYMQPLLDSLSALKQEFVGEPAILSVIDREIQLTELWIAEHMPDDPDESRPGHSFGGVDTPDYPPAQVRGVFDDIDE